MRESEVSECARKREKRLNECACLRSALFCLPPLFLQSTPLTARNI